MSHGFLIKIQLLLLRHSSRMLPAAFSFSFYFHHRLPLRRTHVPDLSVKSKPWIEIRTFKDVNDFCFQNLSSKFMIFPYWALWKTYKMQVVPCLEASQEFKFGSISWWHFEVFYKVKSRFVSLKGILIPTFDDFINTKIFRKCHDISTYKLYFWKLL